MKKIFSKKLIIILSSAIAIALAYSILKVLTDIEEKKSECFENFKVKLTKGIAPDSIFKEDFDKLQYLVERSLVARSQMLKVSSELKEDKDRALTSRELIVLKEGTQNYLDLRENLYEIANGYHCVIDAEDSSLTKFNISKQLQLKSAMLSLAAAITLYDNYFLGIVLFENDSRLRRVINHPDMGFDLMAQKLEEMTKSSSSLANRYRVKRVIDFIESEKQLITSNNQKNDYEYLKLLLESSPSYNYIRENNLKDIANKKFITYETITKDLITESSASGLDILSKFFGNTVGMYESRKGKLYNNKEALENIKANLQPLDILLEKTPFRLTDKLIPGHFGHVAIWTGTKAELIDLGVWDEEHVNSHSDEICSDTNKHSKDEHQIIEALRSGVQLSTLDHFMNIDDFAILRPVFDESKKDQLTKESLIMAFRQLGKSYDFNFDVNTTDKIVCSELAYVSFPSMSWPTEKKLGRYSISPDNVATLAWNDLPLKLIMLYNDGKLVEEDKQVEKMIELMNK